MGASNDFDGNYLKSLGYAGLEKKYIDDFNTNANATVKQWVRITKFKYFTKDTITKLYSQDNEKRDIKGLHFSMHVRNTNNMWSPTSDTY